MSSLRSFTPHYSIGDYLQWTGDWELWNGIPVAMTPSPFGTHQFVAANVARILGTQLLLHKHCRCKVIHEIDWQISDDTVVRPDVVVICHGVPERFLDYAPKVAVEVLSPSTEHKDRTAKRDLYQEQGVLYYLMIDPDHKAIEALELIDGIYQAMPVSKKLVVKVDDCELTVQCEEVFGN